MSYHFMDNEYMGIAQRLRVAIAIDGVSQEDVAKLSGISQGTISRIASGKGDVMYSSIEQLENTFPTFRRLQIEHLQKKMETTHAA